MGTSKTTPARSRRASVRHHQALIQGEAMIQSIRPKKPREDFPLFPHASGRWCKKVLGRAVYFGKVADDLKGERALNLWLEQRDDLLAGRTPRVAGDGLTVPISSTFFS